MIRTSRQMSRSRVRACFVGFQPWIVFLSVLPANIRQRSRLTALEFSPSAGPRVVPIGGRSYPRAHMASNRNCRGGPIPDAITKPEQLAEQRIPKALPRRWGRCCGSDTHTHNHVRDQLLDVNIAGFDARIESSERRNENPNRLSRSLGKRRVAK